MALGFALRKVVIDSMLPAVYAVVLNWNHLEDLKQTLSSLRKQDYSNLRLIVSDNGSTDGSQEYIKSNHKEVIFIENNQNLGWAGGNNVGIRYALRNNADYILLSNNDIYLENSHIISMMIRNFESFTDKLEIAIMGGRVHYYDDREKLDNEGWIMFPKREERGFHYNRFRARTKIAFSSNFKIVDSVDGCFYMVRGTVFKRIGLLKEFFFMYADEIEFSLRAWANEYVSLIDRRITIYHKIGPRRNSAFSMYYRTRNLYLLLDEYKKINDHYYFYLYSSIKGTAKSLVRSFFEKNHSTIRDKIAIGRAIVRGFVDGLLHKRVGKILNPPQS